MSAEKFKVGDRVSLKDGVRYERPLEQCVGVVDGYENYHGVRVWIKGEDALYYAYPEDWLVLVERVTESYNGFEYLVQQQQIGADTWRNCLNWVTADEADARMKRLIQQEDAVVAYGGKRRIKFRIVVRPVGAETVWKEEGK